MNPAKVLAAKNAEVRRYLIKRMGWDVLRSHVSAKTIHTDGNSELIEFNDERYVKVKDSSTDRIYLLYVPNNMQTCRDAIAWTFGLSGNEYNPLIET